MPLTTHNRPHLRTDPFDGADGDFWRGLIKPKIRIMGQWLERAGFKPGNRVQVTCVAPGVIELRSTDALMVNDPKQVSSELPNRSF